MGIDWDFTGKAGTKFFRWVCRNGRDLKMLCFIAAKNCRSWSGFRSEIGRYLQSMRFRDLAGAAEQLLRRLEQTSEARFLPQMGEGVSLSLYVDVVKFADSMHDLGVRPPKIDEVGSWKYFLAEMVIQMRRQNLGKAQTNWPMTPASDHS